MENIIWILVDLIHLGSRPLDEMDLKKNLKVDGIIKKNKARLITKDYA